MKKLKLVLIILVAAVLVLVVAKDLIIKTSIESGVKAVTGLKLNIGSMKIGLRKTFIDIKDLRLDNPRGFEDKVMLDMPVIYVDYDLPAMLKGDVHLNDIEINLKEFVVETNKEGKLNLDSLKMAKAEKEEKTQPAKEKKESKPMQMRIDNLTLKVGKVIYKDYSRGGDTPFVQEFNINLEEKHENISNLQDLISYIMVKALAKTTIAKLTNFDLKGMQADLSKSLAASAEMLETSTGQVMDTTKQLTDDTTTVVNDTVKGLGDLIKSPFGSGEEKK